jgi:hypothetical protein
MVIRMLSCCLVALVGASECPTASCHPATLLVPLPSEITLSTGTAPVEGPVAEFIDQSLTDLGDEGYTLHCHQEGFQIAAPTKRGIFYGRQTLDQMKRLGLIPCCTIKDKPAMRMRAVMFDLARLKEKHDYYYRAIDQLAQYKINTVFLHLTDHSGCAIEFRHYPNLATKYAFSQDEMKRLIKYAQDRHIELIPEIETWGHAKYITTAKGFEDLAEDPNDPRALCTSNPRTWEVLGNMLDEVAALFPSKYIHVGCDEAAFGKCKQCTAKAELHGADALVGEHLKRVYDLVKARGKVPMMWGDVLLGHRGSADILPKDAVITHWDYKAVPPDEPYEFLKDKGFQVVGCPAIVWGSRMILPMADTLDNVTNTARIVTDNDLMGMETTVWVPQRYITDTLWFSLAHAAEMSWSGPRRTRLEFAAAFAKEFFGIDPSTEFAQALLDVHTLSMKSYSKLLDPWEFAKECEELDLAELLKVGKPAKDTAESVAARLKSARGRASSHTDELDALILAAELRAYVEERAVAVHGAAQVTSSRRDEASREERNVTVKLLSDSVSALERLAASNADLTRRLEAVWDRWRYPDDPKKTDRGENLLGGFYVSREFFETVIPRLKEAKRRVENGEPADWDGILRKPERKASGPADVGDTSPAG